MKVSRHKLFFIGYIALVIAGFLSWYIHGAIKNTRAAADNVTITFSPKVGTFSTSTPQDVDVLIQTADASKKISALDLTFAATGPVRFTNITDPVPFPGTDTGLFNQIVRTLTDQKIRISYISLKTDIELPSVIKIRISFQGTGDGVGTITLDQTKTQIVGNVPEKQYGINSADTGTYTFTQGAATNTISVRIDPPSFQLPLINNGAGQFAVALTDIPDGKKISAYNVVVQYDPSLIDITGIDQPIDAATGTDADKFTMLKNTIDPNLGTVELAYIVLRPDSELPTRPKQIIHIRGKRAGSGTLKIVSQQITGNIPEAVYLVNIFNGTFDVVNAPSVSPTISLNPTIIITQPSTGSCTVDQDCADNQLCSSNVCLNLPCRAAYFSCIRTIPRNHTCAIEYAPDSTTCENGGMCQSGICIQSISPSPGLPTSTPYPSPTSVTPTISQAPGTMNLNLKLKFQGILKKPVSGTTMKVKVTIDGKELNDTKSQVLDFAVDDLGIWSGKAIFTASAGEGYKVYIKGDKHLQKRICDTSPTETASGTYRCGDAGHIALQTGDNNLDFSQIVELSGDLPDQDGVVDAYDISYIRLNLGSIDPKVISVGDINHDGILDTQDYSLLVASLNVKYDEL